VERFEIRAPQREFHVYALTAKIAGRRRHGKLTVSPESQITLCHRRDNPAHREAVEVLADGQMIGYLEAGLGVLLAPYLDRARPVRAGGRDDGISLDLFIPGRADQIGRNLVEVNSSDGNRTYLVDRRRGICTCPAGRWVWCRHKRELGLAKPAREIIPVSSRLPSEALTSVPDPAV
jgi:hypothetical protein